MLNFSTIKEQIIAAQESEAAKAAEKKEKAEKATKALLDYVCDKIEENMSLDTETQRIFAGINRAELSDDFWNRFEYNGLLFKTRLPEALNERLGDGVEVAFNTLSYDKVEEDEYIIFKFAIELV